MDNGVVLNDGRVMPLFGLGVYQSRRGEETYGAVLSALRAGYRHIDTAEIYRNEEDVGRAVSDFLLETGLPRDALWITTKLWPNNRTGSEVREALVESLDRLGLDYVDLYLIHSPNDKSNRIDQWKALIDLKREGLTLSIGVSNYGIHHLEELFTQTTVVPCVNQIELSPFCTRTELVNFCGDHRIAIEAYSPLTKANKLTDFGVRKMSKKYSVTPAQLLLQWCLQQGYVTIPKSVTPSRIIENIDTLRIFNSSDGEETAVRISDMDMNEMNRWNEGYTTGWDPTKSP